MKQTISLVLGKQQIKTFVNTSNKCSKPGKFNG